MAVTPDCSTYLVNTGIANTVLLVKDVIWDVEKGFLMSGFRLLLLSSRFLLKDYLLN